MKEAPYEIHMKIERLILSGCEVSIQTNEGGAHVPAFCTKEQVARQLWLLYYNRALLERVLSARKNIIR
jgi:hypothetical protein